jgi:diguanylate cyclase (GGDEF)-like protein
MPADAEPPGAAPLAVDRRLARERRARREAEVIAENAIRDLSDTVQALQRSQAVLDETTDFVVIAGIDGTITYMNRALLEALEVADGDAGPSRITDLLTRESRSLFRSDALVQLEKKGVWRGELRLVVPASRREIPVSQVLIGHRGPTGVLDSVSSISRDITEQLAMEAQLTELALHDPLTGLPNRRLFLDRLQTAVTRSKRSQAPLGVLYMDVDGFKTVNDTYGHDAGDDLLIAVADRVVSCLRASDTVCRLGGDEFCALSEDVGDAHRAVEVARRITECVVQPVRVAGHEVVVTLSVGVAVATDAPGGPEQLLRDADRAMYRAKAAGKARIELAT